MAKYKVDEEVIVRCKVKTIIENKDGVHYEVYGQSNSPWDKMPTQEKDILSIEEIEMQLKKQGSIG